MAGLVNRDPPIDTMLSRRGRGAPLSPVQARGVVISHGGPLRLKCPEIFAENFSPNYPTWVEARLRRHAPRQLGCQPREIFRHRCKGRAPPVGLRRLPSQDIASSGGFRTMELAFSVPVVSATKI